MSLKFIKWLIPILLELFKRSDRYPSYFKRNKTIAMLVIACLFSLLLALFMYEQASLHGINSKLHRDGAIDLTAKLSQCQGEKTALIAACGAQR